MHLLSEFSRHYKVGVSPNHYLCLKPPLKVETLYSCHQLRLHCINMYLNRYECDGFKTLFISIVLDMVLNNWRYVDYTMVYYFIRYMCACVCVWLRKLPGGEVAPPTWLVAVAGGGGLATGDPLATLNVVVDTLPGLADGAVHVYIVCMHQICHIIHF